jgi:hypothetical protein
MSFINSVRLSLTLGAIFALTGCATSKADKAAACAQKDWYEIGRRDGAQGKTEDRLAQYRKDCRMAEEGQWTAMYTNGRNAGLVEYCAPDNAFELGRAGISYLYVCPSTVEPGFLQSYRRGQQARAFEIRSQELDAKISTVNTRLLQTQSDFERHRLTSELNALKKSRTEIARGLASVSK